jgi:pSer/pThr/pTyr-binding forkhead associated (FHA) protein
MVVKLKVLQGSNAGKELNISVPKFLIGRSDECQLRPKSDTVSRRHCLLTIDQGQVKVRDLKSRNGTLVNGQRIESTTQLKSGDVLKVGKLEFEVVIDHSLGGTKRPKVRDIKDAATRAPVGTMDDTDISGWLEEADEVDRERRLTDPETRQFKLDETEQVAAEKTDENADASEKADSAADEDEKPKRPEKKEPGKLPKLPSKTTKDSREAAAAMLKKFFNRR